MTIQIDTVEPAVAGFMRIANTRVQSDTNSGSLSASGSLILNVENTWGLGSTGWFLIRGNENGGNASQRMYLWSLSAYASQTRFMYLKLIGQLNAGNNYGNVYAYTSSYANAITTVSQTQSGTNSSVANIYFRNSQGAGCSYSFMNWRTG